MSDVLATGAFIGAYNLDPFTPALPNILAELLVGESVATLEFTAERRLRLSIRSSSDGSVLGDVLSCPLIIGGPGLAIIAARWTLPDHITITLSDGVTIASTRPDVVDTIPREYVIYPLAVNDPPSENLAPFNIEAAKKRHHRFMGSMGSAPKGNRVRADAQYMFASLRENSLQLNDLIALSKSGGSHHIVGLARCLRLLIAEGDSLPLLQRCAAHTGCPLILYTNDKPTMRREIHNAAFRIIHNFSAMPSMICRNPIDLDLWLDLCAGHNASRTFTHRQFIMTVANTVAAHVDRDMDPIVRLASTFRSSANPTKQLQNAFRAYVLDLSECINVLVTNVLASADQARP